MTDQDYETYVRELDNIHQPDAVPEQSYSELPAGTYQARLDKLYISKSKTSGRTQTVFEFNIVSGMYAFRTIFKFGGMMTAEQLDYLTNDLRRVGIQKFKWSTVKDEFPKVLDKVFEVSIKKKGEYTNVYIGKELTSEDFVSATIKNGNDVPF